MIARAAKVAYAFSVRFPGRTLKGYATLTVSTDLYLAKLRRKPSSFAGFGVQGSVCCRSAASPLNATWLRSSITVVMAAAWLIVLTGCNKSTEPREITRIESRSPHDRPYRLHATSAERFGYNDSAHHHAEPSAPVFQWDTPTGWRETPPTTMRLIQFRIGIDDKTECYLSLLPGAGGGAVANINRWRKQMGVADYTPEEIAALPTTTIFGVSATNVAFDGDYTGMQETEALPGYRLLGAILEHAGQAIFVKMVGPRDVVASEEANFDRFCRSLRLATDSESARHEHPALSDHQPQSGTVPFHWTAPRTWTQAESRGSMRVVTYRIDAESNGECYIVTLPGSAGGVADNVNRWRREMGRDPFTDDEIAALRTIPMLGRDAVMMEVTGDYKGMSGQPIPAAMTVGAICALPSHTVFVKMVGPEQSIRAQIDNFVAFAKSLEWN